MIRDLIHIEPAPGTGAMSVSRETPVSWIPLERVLDNPFQPRQHYDAEHILNLALSIKQLKGELRATRGLQQLPLARLGHCQADGAFVEVPRLLYGSAPELRKLLGQSSATVQLMFGHSRLRAFRVLAIGLAPYDPTLLINQVDGHRRDSIADLGIDLAGLAEWQTRYADLMQPDQDYEALPVTLGFALDVDMWRHAITENSQRKNINAIEEARSMAVAKEQFGLTDAEAALPFGYARSTAANKIRLLDLPPEVQASIANGTITERHGRELLRLSDDPKQLATIYNQTVQHGFTVQRLTEDVGGAVKSMKEDQAQRQAVEPARVALAAGWTPPGSKEPLPADRIISKDSWRSHFFDMADPEHKALLETGMCGAHCACCTVGYAQYPRETYVRPDPVAAPHACLGCSADYNDWFKRLKLLKAEHPDAIQPTAADVARKQEEQEKRAKIKAINEPLKKAWQTAIDELDIDALWVDVRFWQLLYEKLQYSLTACLNGINSIEDLRKAIFRNLLSTARGWNSDLGEQTYKATEIESLLDRLRTMAGKPAKAQPMPGDSQQTNWRDGWDDDDQALYDDIDGEPGEDDGGWAGLPGVLDDYTVVPPRVLLRLIEECPDKGARGELWRRYNELQSVSQETEEMTS